MALWGKTDEVNLTGSVTATEDETSISGANTAFTEELSIQNTILLGTNKYVISSIIDDENATIRPEALETITDTSPQVSTSPKYLSDDQAINEVSLVTTAEAQSSINREKGVKTPGWTLYKEYGSGRKRIEVLVPLKS